jgi:hypothetical protein
LGAGNSPTSGVETILRRGCLGRVCASKPPASRPEAPAVSGETPPRPSRRHILVQGGSTSGERTTPRIEGAAHALSTNPRSSSDWARDSNCSIGAVPQAPVARSRSRRTRLARTERRSGCRASAATLRGPRRASGEPPKTVRPRRPRRRFWTERCQRGPSEPATRRG